MNEVQKLRTPELIGSEIRSLTNQTKSVTLWFGIEIGRRLCEAKELVGHGNWLGYLESETEFSQSTANRFMTVFKEYGSAQSSLFGAESNYPALNNLSISNALRSVKNYSHAIDDYTKAISLNPDIAEVYFNRGLAYLKLGNKQQAVADLSKAGELGLYDAYSIIKQQQK